MEDADKEEEKQDGTDRELQKDDHQDPVQLKRVHEPEPILEAEKVYDGPGPGTVLGLSAKVTTTQPGTAPPGSLEKDIDTEVTRQLLVLPADQADGGLAGGAVQPEGNGLGNRAGLSNGNGHSNGNGGPGLRNRRGLSNGEGIFGGDARTLRARRGISNGNGLSNGNGISNGNGFVNGRKGIVNGSLVGITGGTGSGRPGIAAHNGGLVDADGVRNGHGMVNGRGMVNGDGITNGRKMALSGPHPARGRSAGWIIGLVVLAVVLTSVTVFFSLTSTEKGIRVDGSFSDWSAIPKLPDDVADQTDPQINIVEYALDIDGSYASFYIKTEGRCFGGAGNGLDSAYIFLDTDQDASTGYMMDSAGAEYVLIADGYDGRVIACGLYKFTTGTARPSNDWNARSPVGSCRAAVSGQMLECQISLQDIGAQGRARMNVLFYTSNSAGEEDFAALTGTERASLQVTWSRTGPASAQPGATGVEMLRVELFAIGGNVSLSSLRVHAAGALVDTDVSRIAVFSSTGLELPGSGSTFSGGVARLVLEPPVDVPAAGTTVLSVAVYLAPGAGTGKAIGLGIGSPADVTASTPAVSIEWRSQQMTYIGTGAGAIVIDGAFSDWDAYPDHPDPSGDVSDQNIDVTGFWLANDTSSLYFCVKVEGEMMGGAGIPERKMRPSGGQGGGGGPVTLPILVGEDALFIFLDTDSRVDTGYSGGGLPLGADFMVNITGQDGHISSRRLHSFTGGVGGGSWSWSSGTDISAATDMTRLEAGVPLGGLGAPSGEVGVFYYMTDWRQLRDTGGRISFDMRTQGGRGLAGTGSTQDQLTGQLQPSGLDHPPLHAPEFEQVLAPIAGMMVVFVSVRASRKRPS